MLSQSPLAKLDKEPKNFDLKLSEREETGAIQRKLSSESRCLTDGEAPLRLINSLAIWQVELKTKALGCPRLTSIRLTVRH